MADAAVEKLTQVVTQLAKDLSTEKMNRLSHVNDVEKKSNSASDDIKDLERKVEALQKKVAELEKSVKKK